MSATATVEFDRTASAPQERSTPTVWGLSLRELYDAYWTARGVQVIRLGEPVALQRAAELYMLISPGRMVLFNLRQFADRMLWRNARVTRLTVIDEHLEAYSEQLDLDTTGNVRSIVRRYRPRARGSARVLMTTSRRIASIWMHADRERGAWERIRRSVAWSSIDYWRTSGDCFHEESPIESRVCLNRIIERWPRPDQAIDGIELRDDAVWALAGTDAAVGTETVLTGPVWAGRGGEEAVLDDDFVVGPAWVADRGPRTPEATALVRPIHLVEPADAARAGSRSPRPGWANSIIKRAFDFFASAIGLVLLAPIFPLVMLAIIIEDGRPVFFSHSRQTRGGGIFRCWKFRTMVHNASSMTAELREKNQADGPQFFIEDDPRVTKVGRVLRKFHIDEFPQLWNVLVGQMSLVGPRPSPDDENQYCPAWRDTRLSVRPGITGLWQLKRTREEGTDFQEWIKYDIEYVRNASLWLDVRIMFMTVWNIFFGRQDDADE